VGASRPIGASSGKRFIRPLDHTPERCARPATLPRASTRAFLLRCAGAGAALWLPPPLRARQTGEPLAVLFPDLGEPYRKVFADIIGGIERQAGQRMRAYPLSPSHSLPELAMALRRNGTRVVVALGRQGLKAAAAVDAPQGVVVGGVSSVPDGARQFGICLTPDPALLFAQLKALLPEARRVIVVYNPAHNDWLLRIAQDAARALGLELAAHEARDLAGAARLYQALIGEADARRDALWLPSDPTTVDEDTILPIVLRASWKRHLPIFSSSFSHINKGVLFALYPNNAELGRALGALAGALLAGEAPPRGVTPLREVLAALNTRTASHFGITLDARLQRQFHTLYPAP
jgi:putative ABC transport system substrate-binding protein